MLPPLVGIQHTGFSGHEYTQSNKVTPATSHKRLKTNYWPSSMDILIGYQVLWIFSNTFLIVDSAMPYTRVKNKLSYTHFPMSSHEEDMLNRAPAVATKFFPLSGSTAYIPH